MNSQEKVKQQKMIQQNLEGINRAISNLVASKNTYRGVKVEIEKQQDTYSPEFLANKTIEEEKKYLNQCQLAYDDFVKRLEELRSLINERDAELDLENPALSNALKLIEISGNELGYENIRKINSTFVHDQSSLKALQAVYKTRGITNTFGLDSQIYDVNSKIDFLEKLAEDSIVRQGSLNYLASELKKIADIEGQELVATPDEQGFLETMRKGAGLS